MLSIDRFFDHDPSVRQIAWDLYKEVKDLPIVCPHGHVDPKLFAENQPFPNPTELILIPDHYIYRMLYSQGISLESLGIPTVDGSQVETEHRKIWQIFGENWYLFTGTPTSLWLTHEFHEVFGIEEKLNADTAMKIYDQIQEKLAKPEFLPRTLFERFNIEVLTTTDNATSDLGYHKKIKESEWNGRVIPCFRPDGIVNINAKDWKKNIENLSEVSGIKINNYSSYIKA
ncbi:MAG: glucuronate isomerase, partial [Candidatus Marinimicrobia bacterium]|nr:glucuronate isomerase [Candidatus Neomarinimicrobiota bacterium]